MEQLYKFSQGLQRSSPRTAVGPTVTIVYAGDNNRGVGSDEITWYCRNETRHRSTSTKRLAGSEAIQNQMEDTKKRKLARNNKRVDVGSLLGFFS